MGNLAIVPKRTRIAARISVEQKALFERAAALQGASLTEFLVQSAQEAAEAIIRDTARMQLSDRDTAALVEALLAPPPPTETLLEALRLHRATVESRV